MKIIAASGSALPGELAIRAMDTFGDVLYNLYGSTEVAWATIATPADLRAAPGTAGKPPMGTVVKLLDEQGHEVPQGQNGRIFVANEMVFEGYTGGGGKEIVEGLMSTGDVGRMDAGGRLFVDGRDDEMIVSGGENVFPREVEDLLADHEAIEEAAVIGVEDDKFGQRLKAFVVSREGFELDEEDVKEYVKHNLARYKVPREVVFVEELPRNATGKVLKRELHEIALTRAWLTNLKGCWRDGHPRPRWVAPERGRGAALRAGGAHRAVDARRRALRGGAGGGAGEARRVAHAGNGYALRLRFAREHRGTLHALPEGRRAADRGRCTRGRPARRRGGALEPVLEEETLDLAGLGARCARAGAAGAGAVSRGLRRAVCGVRADLNEAGPEHAHERAPDPRWAKLSELKLE